MPPDRSLPPCPICGRTPAFGLSASVLLHPFCCRRCADVDLGRWLTGQYVVPAIDGEDEEAASRIEIDPAAGSSGDG